MFVRIKKINGIKYGYLVENTWTPKGSRQSVTAYLGKIIKLEKKQDNQQVLAPKAYNELILEIIKAMLANHGFVKATETTYKLEDVTIDIKHQQIMKENKPAILSINNGYLCNHTIAELLNFSKKENPEKTAIELASALVGAGISISTENMVVLYESICGKQGF